LQYTPRERDGTGLYYHRTRYYSPSLQRYISEDPLGLGGGDINCYAYAFNSPTNFVDPFGLACGRKETGADIVDAVGDLNRRNAAMVLGVMSIAGTGVGGGSKPYGLRGVDFPIERWELIRYRYVQGASRYPESLGRIVIQDALRMGAPADIQVAHQIPLVLCKPGDINAVFAQRAAWNMSEGAQIARAADAIRKNPLFGFFARPKP